MGKDLNRHPQQLKAEDLSDEVREFLEGETEELPEGAEEISNEEAVELEKKAIEAEPVDEQKKYANKKESYLNEIKELEEKNVVLEKEAEKFENIASTINIEPFKELKELVKDAIKIYTDRDDLKELKKKIKNFDAINQMESLLTEYKELAEDNRANITANNNDIKTCKEKIEELEEKITHFQAKLDFGDKSETGANEA